MATKKYVTLENLQHLKTKTDEIYVKKEYKTGSEEEYKVLSDNNLTDELKTKIENAGDSAFDGNYNSLTNKPSIDGSELSSSSTAEELGLAKTTNLPKAATTLATGLVKPDGTTITVEEDGTIKAVQQDLSTYAQKSELPKQATTLQEGTVKPDGTTITVAEGVISANLSGYVQSSQIEDMLTKTDAAQEYLKKTEAESDYLKSELAESTYLSQSDATDQYLKKDEASTTYVKTETATTTYATKNELQSYAQSEQVTSDISGAKQELTQQIDSKLSSTYKPKGSKATVGGLPAPSKETVGDVYNMTNAFNANENFLEGAGAYYPAGTNVVVVDAGDESYKYDTLSGVVDLTPYVKSDELVAVTDDEIDQLLFPEE